MSDKDLLEFTEKFYDSKDANAYFSNVWGGEDIHIGIYDPASLSIKKAGRKTIKVMLRKLPSIKKTQKVLDIGSGYGGAARFLAEKYKCKVDCLNLSEKENERNRKLTEKAELDELITITKGNFEHIPFPRESYDLVWSQDALFHTHDKGRVLREAARVLKPEGRFIFTDIMQSEDCPDGALKDVLARFQLEKLGSVKNYMRLAGKTDLERVFSKRMPEHLITHYTKVLEKLEKDQDKIAKKTSKKYVKELTADLQRWIEAAEAGYLTWGILQFQKRNI